jgi:DNA-directed RNA polymerase specialized sigma24 family protein
MDDGLLEALVLEASRGDEDAWQALWCRVEPRLRGYLRRCRTGARPDELADVMVTVMARLRAHGFRRLRRYVVMRAMNPTTTFMRWLMVVARRVMIDCVRADPEYLDRRHAGVGATAGRWCRAEALPVDLVDPAARGATTARLAADEVFRYATGVLPVVQRDALELWAHHGTTADIAARLGLRGPADAQRLVRAAIERLRRYFRRQTAA